MNITDNNFNTQNINNIENEKEVFEETTFTMVQLNEACTFELSPENACLGAELIIS